LLWSPGLRPQLIDIEGGKMGVGLRDSLRAGLGTIDEWNRDRLADLEHGAAELEAKGHQLFREGLRNGQDMVAKTTSDLREFAKRNGFRQATPPQSSQRPATKPGVAQSSRPSRASDLRSREQQFLENAKHIVAETQQRAQIALQRAGESKPVRDLAGLAANAAGNAVGVRDGAAHMGQDFADLALLGLRFYDPMDSLMHPPGERAVDHVFDNVRAVAGVTKDAIADPHGAAEKLLEKGRKLIRDTVPSATPESPTLSGEMSRRYEIGRHQGEVVAELTPYAVGGGELKVAADIRAITEASLLAKYADQGFTRTQAKRLARPYDGVGHHSLIPQRARLPKWLGGGQIPRAILDSPFNVLKPEGLSQGDFYERHFKVDPEMDGANLRGGGWSGKRLGLERYDLPERIWYGTPNATKRAIAGVGILGTVPFNEGDPQ
jgi:hypothetical protein